MEKHEIPKFMVPGDHIAFNYNGKERLGTVERVCKTFVTIKHDKPDSYDNKIYSSYSFKRIPRRIRFLA
jgi:hypothetical protein